MTFPQTWRNELLTIENKKREKKYSKSKQKMVWQKEVLITIITVNISGFKLNQSIETFE